MYKQQNLHSHSLFCDGSLSLEEMVNAAIQKGCDSFGFSGHSYTPFDDNDKYSMSPEDTTRYFSEGAVLKEKYEGIIDLYFGVEQEYYSEDIATGSDFVIGSVHYVLKDCVFISVDYSAESFLRGCEVYYGGDFYAMAEDYFEALTEVPAKTNADFIGHFDIITKFNSGSKFFSETHPRYTGAALGAIDKILNSCNLFEVNTATMYKLGRLEPYPAVFLLKEISKRGGEVVITSDSHDAGSICYGFNETKILLASCGFRYSKQLTKDGFVDVSL